MHHINALFNGPTAIELVGICKGIVADSNITKGEVVFLHDWLLKSKELNDDPITDDPIVNMLYRRIKLILSDNIVDNKEKKELLELLQIFTGQETTGEVKERLSTTIPLDAPPPEVNFNDKVFCLTGKFAYGPRRIVIEAIEERGGRFKDRPNWKTDYTVIGFFATTAWANASYGRKIESAIHYREQGSGIAIITEDHWAKYAFRMGR